VFRRATMNPSVKSLLALLVAAMLALSSIAHAAEYLEATKPSGEAIAGDILFVRPVGLIATLVGSAIFVIGLPFTIPSGSVRDSAKALIADPARYTFSRPLGVDQAKPLSEVAR
ncbi:MAG: hypothetical protein ACREUV_08485, partial [Burkholderiales bacterium]